MMKRIVFILVGAAVPALIASTVAFQIDTKASRKEAAEIRARAESQLARLAQPGSLSRSERASLEATGSADDAALLRIRVEQEQSARKAGIVGVTSFGMFAMLGVGFTVIAGRRRGSAHVPRK